jgi:hypothetical protein
MRPFLIMLSLALASLVISGCGGSPNTIPTEKGPSTSKGKRIVDCMDRGSPEECDRQINRRSRAY